MSGAPIVVTCYRNGIDSHGTWVTDATAMTRVRALAAEGGKALVADVIWYEREPWTMAVTSAWPAVDSFDVALALDTDHTPPGGETVARKKPQKKLRGR
jgi:sugar phosphate isomerase/epimerase